MPEGDPNQPIQTEPENKANSGWLARVRHRLRTAFTWRGAGLILKACLVAASRFGWTAAGILALAAFVQSMTSEIVSVDSISVPRTFAENGFTSDVASQRLRDALTRFARKTGSSMESPLVALTSELPKITIPKVDISIDTLTTLLRNLFHLGSTHNLSGEFVLQGDTVWLRLRKDAQEIFTGNISGFDPAKVDGLLDAAAPNVVRGIRPYLIASATYKDDPDQALEMAEGIIARLPSSDINVQWSRVLQGKYYLDRHQAALAEGYLRKAVSLNSSNPAAHYNLAVALDDQGNVVGAIAEYRRVIHIQKNNALAHNNLGILLQRQDGIDEAIAEYQLAVAWDPFSAAFQNNLASALKQRGRLQDAIARYRRAIEIDPRYARAHYNLGVVLKEQGKWEDAVAEFRLAIGSDKNDVPPHIGLARTLLELKRTDEAIKEYETILTIDPKNEFARGDLVSLRAYVTDRDNKQ